MRHRERICFALTIYSAHLTPEQISELLGCQPSKVRRAGDPRLQSSRVWDRNVWSSSETIMVQDGRLAHDVLPNALTTFLTGKQPIARAMASLATSNDVELLIGIRSVQVPALAFSVNQLSMITQFGAALDIDIVLAPDEVRSELPTLDINGE